MNIVKEYDDLCTYFAVPPCSDRFTLRDVVEVSQTFLKKHRSEYQKILKEVSRKDHVQLRECYDSIKLFFEKICIYAHYYFGKIPSKLRVIMDRFENFVFEVWKSLHFICPPCAK